LTELFHSPFPCQDHPVLLPAGGVFVVDVELGAGEHDHGAGGFIPLVRYNTLSFWCIRGSSLGFERVGISLAYHHFLLSLPLLTDDILGIRHQEHRGEDEEELGGGDEGVHDEEPLLASSGLAVFPVLIYLSNV